jgi:hypothetical protein
MDTKGRRIKSVISVSVPLREEWSISRFVAAYTGTAAVAATAVAAMRAPTTDSAMLRG